ncbi:MAG: PPC domain-containing protein, partial [Planctomycetia bacterium]
LILQDPVASVVAPEDGLYTVLVRESAYAGDGNCSYRMHVGSFPRPIAVFPLGGKMGDEVEVKFLGDPAGDIVQKFKLPAKPVAEFPLFAEQNGQSAPSSNPFRVVEFGNVLEVEPNDALTNATATAEPLPMAFNGAIGQKNDYDYFKFKAAKGSTYDVHVYAQRLGSALDPVLYLFNSAGGVLVGNDDAVGQDSYLRYTFPEDGEYLVRVYDHLLKGGFNYTYRVEFQPVKPLLQVSIPKFGRYSQERQTIPVPKGNRFAQLLTFPRTNFGGDLIVEADALPPGVTMSSDVVSGNLTQIPVLFEAAPDAVLSAVLTNLSARHADANQKIRGEFELSADLVVGPNQAIMRTCSADRAAVAVTEEAPFKVDIVEPKAPLVQGGSMMLKVVATRKPDFKAPITLQMLVNPPGVGSAVTVAIPEGQNEAYYALNANGDAELKKSKIAILANAPTAAGVVWTSSQLASIQVAPPMVTAQLQMAAAEQGQPVEVVVKLEQTVAFDGKAKMQLVGLPPLCTTQDIEITKDMKEAVFKVTVDPKTPPGQHKTMFCVLTIVKENEPVVHNLAGGGVLRVDPPPPPKPNAPPPPPPPPAA